MVDQLRVLQDVIARLDRAGIPYMVTGSMAMNHYAQPRMTRDIDLVVDLTKEDATRIEELFAKDYHLGPDSVRRAIDSRGMFNLIHYGETLKVDFIVRKDTAYRELEFQRRRQVSAEGMQLWMVSAEDLLLSKLEWYRHGKSELQLRDIHNLVESVQDLDRGYLTEWAAKLGLAALLDEVAT